MKLTVLVDDNETTDKNLDSEHGLSFFIEHDDVKILFDVGASDIFIKNAEKLCINPFDIDYLIISHGHDDHTDGLPYFIKNYTKEKNPILIAHEDALKFKGFDEGKLIGSPLGEEELAGHFELKLSSKPYWITKNIVFLGEIIQENSFEPKLSKEYIIGSDRHGFLYDDSALAINTEKGIIIVAGCSHSGIANICEYAKKVCSNDKIYSVIGGIHLKKANDERINRTAEYFESLNIDSLYLCHCTGQKAIDKLESNEVKPGLEILL